MAAGAYLVRAIGGWPMSVGALQVPLWLSWLIVLVAGSAATGLGWRARRQERAQGQVDDEPPMRWEPLSVCRQRRARGRRSSAVYTGVGPYHFVDEEHEEEDEPGSGTPGSGA